MCVCRYASPAWRPGVNCRCLLVSILFFWDRFTLSVELSIWGRLADQWAPSISVSVSQVLGLQRQATTSSFYVGVQDANSGPQNCSESTLPSGSSCQFHSLVFSIEKSTVTQTQWASSCSNNWMTKAIGSLPAFNHYILVESPKGCQLSAQDGGVCGSWMPHHYPHVTCVAVHSSYWTLNITEHLKWSQSGGRCAINKIRNLEDGRKIGQCKISH